MRKKLPVIIGKNMKKGIFAFLDKDRQPNVCIAWLKKDYKSGDQFDMSDIDKIQTVLHFCDKESVKTTIKILETMLKMMPEDKNG